MRRWCAAALIVLAGCRRSRPEVPILNYHSVGAVADDYTVPLPAFAQQLDWLEANGYRTVSLHDLLESRAGRGALPAKAVILTFDDGKEDALRLVLPALQQRRMRATFFVITGLVGQPGYLTWEGVRALAEAGMEIGSHTVTHPRLADAPAEQVAEELRLSREQLEANLHRPIHALAYPFNSVRSRIETAAAAAGYSVAVAGPDHGNAEAMRLLRIHVDGGTSIAAFAHAVSP